jgi:hypothetical protein|tara:strand:- start:76 stop:1392 length:1317 start_codon:yes stop_codon:yes gene_type:complete
MQKIRNEMRKLVRSGFDKEQISSRLKHQFPETKENVIDKIVNEKNDSEFRLAQKIMRSNLFTNMREKGQLIFMDDPFHPEIKQIEKAQLRNVLDKDAMKDLVIRPCEFVYDPFKRERVYEGDDLISYFNNYEPPTWMVDEYGQYKEVERVDKMPELFHRFFIHLSNGKESEYNYMVKWLANSIQDRNFCVLTAIGAPGIGKGVLGNIMLGLVGLSNFTKTDNKLISKDFNAQIRNKRLVFCDEINIKKTNHMNKFKDLVNDKIEIEGKGKDAKLDDNYASIYVASNNLDSLYIPENDRRFSVIELTNNRLDSNFTVEEIEQLNELKNIEELAKYLYHYEVDKDEMLKVHRSQRLEDIKLSTLTDAQEWFLEDYAVEKKGQVIDLTIVQEAFREKEFKALSRSELSKLQERFSTIFKITFNRMNGKRVRRVKFFGEKNG